LILSGESNLPQQIAKSFTIFKKGTNTKMEKRLKLYSVSPSVVEADKESVISIRARDGAILLFDDVTYDVECIPIDESDVPLDADMTLWGFNKSRRVQKIKPVNGELRVPYFFKGEQEWRIHISTKEYGDHTNPLYLKNVKEHSAWQIYIDAPKKGFDVYVYSLREDLYNKRVRRGDLHIHTTASDGDESPCLTAANYRKAGFDFISVTDHAVYHASADAEKKLAFLNNFTIIPGEEVHNNASGYFHMVNVGGSYSISDIFSNEKERVAREVEELSKELKVPDGLDPHEYLSRAWMYREIKKSGGYAILPHVYWYIGYHHVQTKMSMAIIKNGLCDAFELLGGNTPDKDNLQLSLYNDLRQQGHSLPIVGSSDSHTVFNEKRSMFKSHSTVAFTENDDIIGSIARGYSVAVEALPNEKPHVYGSLRLTMYTQFLMKNYFPVHDELCLASGSFIEEYVQGNESARETAVIAEERVSAFEKKFFGR